MAGTEEQQIEIEELQRRAEIEELRREIASQKVRVAQLERSWKEYRDNHDWHDKWTQRILLGMTERADDAKYDLQQMEARLIKLRGLSG